MFPFDRPTNYGEMLNKIGFFTLISAVFLTMLLAIIIPEVGHFLDYTPLTVKFLEVEVPLLAVLPGAVVAVLARAFRLHDTLSDVFRIRSIFDLNRILIPLASAVGVTLTSAQKDKLRTNRKSAMNRLFYDYASFEEPKISKALVLSAIDSWSWYWILLESTFLVFVAAIVLLVSKHKVAATWLFATGVVFVLMFTTVFKVCGRKAKYQIDEIVEDQARLQKIRLDFARFI